MIQKTIDKSVQYFKRLLNKVVLLEKSILYKKGTASKITVTDAKCVLDNVYKQNSNYDLVSRSLKSDDNINLSVIIPVFNGEKYLATCIESILNQQSKYTIELICVDDGSTDNSLQVLDQYLSYANFKVVHQSNRGISAARNRGIEEASGKYLLFVDNDDFIDSDFVEKMLNRAYETNADIVKCGYRVFVNGKNGRRYIEDKDVMLRDDTLARIYEFNGFCWGMLIRKSLFEFVEFPTGYWYEDMCTRLILYPQCKIFAYIGQAMYHYRFHNNNASKNVWKATNVKVLDQFYLTCDCFFMSERAKFKYNNSLCLAYQYEIGKMLYERTKYLDENIRESVFVLACEFNDKLNDKCKNYAKNGKKSERVLNRVFVARDYENWKKVCQLI